MQRDWSQPCACKHWREEKWAKGLDPELEKACSVIMQC